MRANRIPRVSATFRRKNVARSPETATRPAQRNSLRGLVMYMVGATGFEPATSCSRSRRSTGLSYAPPTLYIADAGVGRMKRAQKDSNLQPSDP